METPLEMAPRHVIRGEYLVARQERIVTTMLQSGHDTWLADAVLNTLRDLLKIMREDLDREEARSGRSIDSPL